MQKKHKNRILAFSVSGALLLTGVSAYALHELNKINASEFANSKVIIGNQELSMQDFYENVSFKNNQWVYTDTVGKEHKLQKMTDFNLRNNSVGLFWDRASSIRHTRVDTVYYTKVVNDKWHNIKADSVIIYQLGENDSLLARPSQGIAGYGTMVIRQYEPKNTQRDMQEDIYNDKYNCTSAHEGQHFMNAGHGNPNGYYKNPSNVGQIGQSYELTYVEACLDEISANIAQLLAQRRNYLTNGKDMRYITPRFKFYAEALKKGIISPTYPTKISEEETAFIANGVFDAWMADKYDSYVDRNQERTLLIHSTNRSNYNSVLEDLPRHERVVRHMFKIEGIDFSPYIMAREHEILERITPEQQKIFDEEVQKKKEAQEGRHLDELEYTRMTKGQKAYEDEIERNVRVAKANKFIANFKNFFGNQK